MDDKQAVRGPTSEVLQTAEDATSSEIVDGDIIQPVLETKNASEVSESSGTEVVEGDKQEIKEMELNTAATSSSVEQSLVAQKPSEAVDGVTEDEASPDCIICLSEIPVSPPSTPIATLVCGHFFHNNCLETWCNVANTCPLCRVVFHKVDLYEYKGGPWVRAYPVQDKIQGVSEGPDLSEVRCIVCGRMDQEDMLMLCDGCDDAYHTFCLDMTSVPVHEFYCPNCMLLNGRLQDSSLLRMSNILARSNTRPARASRVSLTQQRLWTRAWNELRNRTWQFLDADLAYLSSFQNTSFQRSSPADEWIRRRVEQTSRRSRHTDVNSSRTAEGDSSAEPCAHMNPEEQKAWSELEVLRRNPEQVSDDAERTSTTSPRSKKTEERSNKPTPLASAAPTSSNSSVTKLKRPIHRASDRRESVASSSSVQTSPQASLLGSSSGGPSFLANLVSDIKKPTVPGTQPILQLNDIQIPSHPPALSDTSASASSSPSPPPFTPLFSHLAPKALPVIETHHDAHDVERQTTSNTEMTNTTHSSKHSTRLRRKLPLEVKYEVEKMVRATLKPMYHDGQLSKKQFASYNKHISRSLYDSLLDGSLSYELSQRHSLQNAVKDRVREAFNKGR
ncbi:CTD-binding SR-like protein rA9 [Schizosaccharomyces japonicus yFS275]|uniref:CTD-binding SR-like protein rA9 n=1 Tax=Schizosaccharomyces japonicus (strain yFS275 / FY16936) TaxID=402676 RepID=B6JZF4_SCHJY|nr:CTD-binding SR-like protein rA9 [Schizosaccharomyces japonicus yFS275]EEB06922.1 CTD-binding SR-like protein rA9 [Schizosaccharomyces japonicus yFS275]